MFTDATTTSLPTDVHPAAAIAAGDVDGDGDADLLVAGSGSSTQRYYRNDGSGVFTDVTALFWSQAALGSQSVLVDLDRDGDLDVAAGHWPTTVHVNVLRQLHAPWPARVGRPFALEVWQRGPAGPALAVAFLSTARLGGVPTPFGWLGITPMLTLPPTAVANGTGTTLFVVPASPTLVGLLFHAQAMLVSSPAGPHLTNVTSNVILP